MILKSNTSNFMVVHRSFYHDYFSFHEQKNIAGLHLEIDPKDMYTRGSGGMLPQKILDFRLSETASGAFSGKLYLY